MLELEQGGQSWSLKVPKLGTAPVRAELLHQPQGTAPLCRAVTHSAVTPAGNQDISTAISTPGNQYAVTGLAAGTGNANSYCLILLLWELQTFMAQREAELSKVS